MNTNIEMISSWPHLLIHDPDVASFQAIFLKDKVLNLDGINLVKRIQTKLGLQESSSNWRTGLSIYSPSLGRVVSENGAGLYDQKKLNQLIKDGWQVSKKDHTGRTNLYFHCIHYPRFLHLVIQKPLTRLLRLNLTAVIFRTCLTASKVMVERSLFIIKKA